MYLDYNIGAFRMSMNGEYPFKWTLKLLKRISSMEDSNTGKT